jgi:hypothetical protein
VRTIKEIEDDIHHMTMKNAVAMQGKLFNMHIYITSSRQQPNWQRPPPKGCPADEDVAYWGLMRRDDGGEKVVRDAGPFTEEQLYAAMMEPQKNSVVLGHIHIHYSRPKWEGHFDAVIAQCVEQHVGVTFCGNPGVGNDLMSMCNKKTKQTGGKHVFHLHQEVF